MSNLWEIREIDLNELVEDIKQNKISLPSFQRGVVWNKNQRSNLINTLKRGFPFGTLLIYEDKNKNWQLIDGLQRSITIYSFLSNPSRHFNYDDLDEDALKDIVALGTAINSTDSSKYEATKRIREIIVSHIGKEYKTLHDLTAIQYYDIAKEISKGFGELEDKTAEIRTLVEPMIKTFVDNAKSLENKKVPAIIFKGEQSDLPLIFERINQEGTKLDKYQIYAASWPKNKIKIENVDLKFIVESVAKRYNTLGTDPLSGIKAIEVKDFDYDKFLKDSEVTTFELGYGFGELLSKKYSNIFKSRKSDNEILSLGFNLINACLIKKNNQMDKLHENILGILKNDQLELFLLGILDSVDSVNKMIEPYYKFKGNRKDRKLNDIAHTEFQIISMITSLFIEKYCEIIKNENDEVINVNYNFAISNRAFKPKLREFIKYAKIYYLIDILNGKWSGTGDATLNHIIIDNPGYYFVEFSKEDFKLNMLNWYNNNIKTKNEISKVSNPNKIEKLLLSYVYLEKFSALDHLNSTKYDIDHIIPKELMKKRLSNYKNLKLPISSVANLCLLPSSLNRSKKDKTLYENFSDKDIKDLEEKYTFTKREDLEWLNDTTLLSKDFEENYLNFIERRMMKFISIIKSSLFER